jgi:hypothetical protein
MTVGGLFLLLQRTRATASRFVALWSSSFFFHGDSGHPHFGHVRIPGEQGHLNITAALRLSLQAAI